MKPKTACLSLLLSLLLVAGFLVGSPAGAVSQAADLRASPSDWPDWRGPLRDGTSPETGLPDSWSPDGENLVWQAPYGGRSTPVIMGEYLYAQNGYGEGPTRKGRIMCLDADSGEVLWEHLYNINLSDAPPRRVGWASPVIDPETGNVYAFAVDGRLMGLSPDGDLLWEWQLGEIFGTLSTHGGRTVSPIIEGGNVIVSSVSTGWGALAPPRHRFFAFDKASGEIVWIGSTGNPPYDTTYAPPIVRDIGGVRMLIQGGSDGAVHGLKAHTGELVWSFPMSKRGINTGVVLDGETAVVSHGEENLDTSTMGFIAAIPADNEGGVDAGSVVWEVEGFTGGYSSPVLDGQRVYQVDNGANLVAFDLGTGRELWRLELGTIQKSSPVLADGKLYVGSQNGDVWILRPSQEDVEVLDHVTLSGEERIEEIRASMAVARGKVYLVTSEAIYAIGRPDAAGVTASETVPEWAASRRALEPGAPGPVTHVQVVPKEEVIGPGGSLELTARLFNGNGELVRVVREAAEWSTDDLQGAFDAAGTFTAAADAGPQAGSIRATFEGVTGEARMRVIPDLPIEEDFEDLDGSPAHWVNAGIKYRVDDLGGNKVLVKRADDLRIKRARSYIGRTEWSDMTIQVDVSSSLFRRRMADAGPVAQNYELLMMGNKQTLELSSWRAESERAVVVDMEWQPDTWYTLKLRTENRDDGSVRLLGKAWPRDEPEPAGWQIDHVDPAGPRYGSPGIYADAHAEVMLDNLRVTSNR